MNSKYKYRNVVVKPWAYVFKAPRYVIRIDIEEIEGRSGTHGWQVRYQGHTKFFSDDKPNLRRTPRQSLTEAVAYLDSIYEGVPPKIKKVTSSSKTNEIKEVGIRLVKRLRKAKNIVEINIEVSMPKKGESAKRFYVGTENTVTPQRIEEKLELAKAFRQDMVERYKAEVKSLH